MTNETIEPGTIWDEPGGDYFRQAMEELGLTDEDLEKPNEYRSIMVGDYPTLDRVYARAWELRRADEPAD